MGNFGMYLCTLDLVNKCGSGFVVPLHSSAMEACLFGNPGLGYMVFAMTVYQMLSTSQQVP